MAKVRMNPEKCKVRCYRKIDRPTRKPYYVAYIYEGLLDDCLVTQVVFGATREGVLKKLALQIFDDLTFEEENNEQAPSSRQA